MESMPRNTHVHRQSVPGFAFVAIDRSSSVPLYQQVYESIREAILTGRLAPDTLLPSTRALANDLAVSRNTVLNAFEQLFAEGYIVGKIGSGSYVAANLPEDCVAARRALQPVPAVAETQPDISQRGRQLVENNFQMAGRPGVGPAFGPAVPAYDEFPFEVWNRLVHKPRPGPLRGRLGYPEPGGYWPLREAIASYLRTSRSVFCEPNQVIVCGGSQQAFDLVARLLTDPAEIVAVEEPGYLGVKAAFAGAGLQLRGIRVEADGIDIQRWSPDAAKPKLVYVTPSHQFPLGVTMSLSRRLTLLDWARSHGVWIIEDDYDSEYRYAGKPLASLQGLDRGQRVIYLGTFSKVLFPALRLSYLVVPKPLVESFVLARVSDSPPIFEQMVLADFLVEGHFARHIRRMRALYSRRQAILLDVAGRYLEGRLHIASSDAGMYLLGLLDPQLSDIDVTRAAADAGVAVQPLSPFYLGRAERQGLILGYAAVGEKEMRDAAKRLAGAIDAVRDSQRSTRTSVVEAKF